MNLILYHGSSNEITTPIFGGGKPHNDYGPAFYCTREPDMAREWASAKDRDGCLNAYSFDTDSLDILDLSNHTVLHWLSVLLENRTFRLSYPLGVEGKEYILRNFSLEYRSKDLIIGYRADDSYFAYAQDFLNGTISYTQLGQAMKLGELGIQYAIKSREAFSRLKFIFSESVSSSIWYERRMNRDLMARRQYFDGIARRKKGDLYITSILDEEIKPGDPRLI